MVSCTVHTLFMIDALLLEVPIFMAPVTSYWFLYVLTYHDSDI